MLTILVAGRKSNIEGSHGLRKIVAFVVALLLSAAGAVQHTGSALAFAPKNWISTVLSSIDGLVAVRFQTHQSITESAIRELDAEFFRKPTTTKTMEKAIERIVEANAEVDHDQFQSALHFDGENFVEGQARLNLLSQNIVKSLQAGSEPIDVGIARTLLGGALHTIQDFYAHSNWIEMGNRAPHPALGRPFRAIDQAQSNESTCIDCTGDPQCPICVDNLITKKLTSGYFGGEDRKRPVIIGPSLTKCIHGGIKDSLQPGAGPTIGGINKDVPDCRVSPHSNLHFEAAAVAKEATKQFIRDLKEQLTPKQLRNLLGAGSTLALVIDTTGSMGPIIAGVKDEAISIVNQRLGTDEEPADYVLVPYNDPDFGPLTITDDPDKFKSAISALGADGGGDCPEPAMQAVLAGLAASNEGGVLSYFTDADIKDKGLVHKVVSLAKSKEIKVYPNKFGKCPSSSSEAGKASRGPNEQAPQARGLLAAELASDDPDTVVANGSGGQVFNLQTSEAGKITKLVNFLVRTNSVDLLSLADTLSGTARTYTVPVDSTMTQVTFSVSGTASVTLKRPNGSSVQSTDTGVTVVSTSGGVVYSITSPSAGTWSVAVNGSGTFSITVSGESPLQLNSFRFMELGGRPGHDGYFAIKGLPIAGQPGNVMAQISGGPGSADFEFRSKKGDVLQKFKLNRGLGVSALLFYGEVTPPNQEFLVYVTGQDASGIAYQRALSTAIKAQTIVITTPLSQDLAPGQTTTYVFTVKNLGPAGTFRFSGSDEKGYLRSINPTQFTLSTNQTVDVTVQLQAPANSVAGSSDTLTVTVESTTSDANNFTVVTSAVTGETTLNFPILKSTNDLFTGLAFLNLGSEKVSLTVTAFDENGAALSGTTNPSTLALAASQQLARIAPELFNFAARDNNGWILVKSDKSTVVGFELLGNANVLDGVAATSLSSTALVLTDAELDSTYTTEVHVVNPKNSDSRVTLELHDSSGNQAGKIDFSIPAKGKISKRIQDIFPAISRPFAGYLIIRGDNPILTAELLLSDQSIAALNGQLLQEGSNAPTQLFSAQLATGQGLFYTIFNLVNPTSKTATVVVRAVGEDGSNLAAPFNISLTPGQQFRREVGQMFGFNPGALTSGSLVIESSISGLVGDISFGDPSRSNNFRSSLPLDGAPSKSAVFAHVANAAGFFTGVAMVNPNRAIANVDVKVFRPDQSLVGATRIVIPANGRRSKLLIEIVSASAGQAGGYFTLDSDQPISSFALFGSATLTSLAAIPAQRLQLGEAQNPVPTIAGISPSSVTAGGAAFTLTIDGKNFISRSTVQWNGSNRETTFVSSTQLTAAISAADIAAAGAASVTVFNPSPGGGTSNALTFTINAAANPVPTLTSLSPASATAGGAAFTLTVNGNNFVSSSKARWNGADRTTTFVSSTLLTAAILASDIAAAGTAGVTVFNPSPGGGTSNAATFTIVSTPGTAANLKADYQFQNSRASLIPGAPALTDLGSNSFGAVTVDGSAITALKFAANNGLSLSLTGGVIPNNTYSVVVLFAFDVVSGFRRIVDFKNGASDTGLYNLDGNLNFYNVTGGSGAPISANVFVQAVLTRDAGKKVTGYVNGVQQFSFTDSSDLALIDSNNVLRFFQDNTSGGTTSEASAGSVARIRLYDSALSASAAAALDRLPGSAGTFPTNLLRNPGAEEGAGSAGDVVVPIPGWTTTSNFTAVKYDSSGFPSAAESQRIGGGNNFFSGGPSNAQSTATQIVDVSSEAASIDSGGRSALLRAYLTGFGDGDNATVKAEYLSAGGTVLGSSLTLGPVSGPGNSFQLKEASGAVPAGTRSIRVGMTSTRVSGSFNDGYFDNLFLGLNQVGAGTINPIPAITSLSPSSATTGGPAFTLTVNGSNYVNGSVVQWNGSSRTTTFISSSQLGAAINAADIAVVGSASVTVFNPAPGGGTSNAQTFTIVSGGTSGTAPTITNVVPSPGLVGTSMRVSVTLSDPDGDIVRIDFDWYSRGVKKISTEAISPKDVNLVGLTSGTVTLLFSDFPFLVSTLDRVDVQATDSKGNKSNVFSRTF